MRRMFVFSLVALAISFLASSCFAQDSFYLKGGERVVFFGDSITQAGGYIDYVDAYLRTRFPDKTFTLVNRGVSSETVSGTTEPDHSPPRPNAHDRFARDVTAAQPDVLVACFGMNDGIYHPFNSGLFASYKAGIDRLRERAKTEAKTKLVLLTPPPFDPYRRKATEPAAKHFGYRYPAADYDESLTIFSRHLVSLASPALLVVDVHGVMNEHLNARRQTLASFSFSPDGVHPDATGHWLMAQALLTAWNAPAVCAEAKLDAESLAAVGKITEFTRDGRSIQFRWQAPLPLPRDKNWNAESLAVAQSDHALSRLTLAVTNLPAGNYQLNSAGKNFGEATAEELTAGIDLMRFSALPAIDQGQQVLKIVQERNKLMYSAWRKTVDAKTPAERAAALAAQLQAEKQAASQDAQLRLMCVPKPVAWRIARLGDM